MQEYVTDAIVLNTFPRGEADRIADLYTEHLGRIEVRMIGGRKPLSKLAPHLDIMGFATVRLVEKNQFTLVDAMSAPSSREMRDLEYFPALLSIAALVRALAPRGVPDVRLWNALRRMYLERHQGAVAEFLKILGYDARHASCEECGDTPAGLFFLPNHEFFCARCGSKLPQNEVIYSVQTYGV